jgi:rhodanese-related sulfurtransferase
MLGPVTPAPVTVGSTFFIQPLDLWHLIGTPNAPVVLDVSRRDIYDGWPGVIPTSRWRDPNDIAAWEGALDRNMPIAVACKAGHDFSQAVVSRLRGNGFAASAVEGGNNSWTDAGLPRVSKPPLDRLASTRPSLWVTRRRPKIDRIACPWLVRRFLDAEARFLFVEPDQVQAVAGETGAIPFDIKNVELSHDGERCTFDTMLALFGLESEPSLARLALIVRGADTARPDLAPEAAGLHAVSLGLSALAGDDDHGLLQRAFLIYDALFAWLRFAADERHNWPVKAA